MQSLARDLAARVLVLEEDDVVAVARRAPEAVDAARDEELLVDDAAQELLRGLVEVARGGAVLGVIEDLREAAPELPRGEEERPVDVGDEALEREIVDCNLIALAKENCTFDCRLKLTNVARPTVIDHQLACFGSQPAHQPRSVPRMLFDEVIDEHRNVFAPFAKRRHVN